MNYLITFTLAALGFFIAAALAEVPWTRAQRREALVGWCARLNVRAARLHRIACEHDQQNGLSLDVWLKWDTRLPWYRFRFLDVTQRVDLWFYSRACRLWERTYA